jgi:lauroyl/myristoyl acyltransferase
MHLFSEFLFLFFLSCCYWLCGERRRYLKNRIGRSAFKNVYRVGRNIHFMLKKTELEIDGDVGVLDKGCILYSFHFGVWELMPRTLSKLGYKTGIIVNRYAKEDGSIAYRIFDGLLRRWRSKGGIKVFYKENTLEIVRFLKSGGVFGVLVDGNSFYQKHTKVQKLAELCRVPLVPFAACRRARSGVLHVGCDLPRVVKSRPLDYMWFYKSR